MELINRIIPGFQKEIKAMVRLHQPSSENDLDLARWMRIKDLRNEIAKDTGRKPSIISQIKEAFLLKDFQKASDLQIKLYA